MKKTRLLSLLLVGALTLGLVGCGGSTEKNEDNKVIKIGVTSVPHEEIVNAIKPLVEEKGYTLEVKPFDDYNTPNTAVYEGELDANYYQHIAFLNETNEAKGYDLVNIAEIHIEPMTLYSKTAKSLDEIKDGDKIAIPNDATNEARALRVLEDAGLIKVKPGELVTPNDIIENPKNLKFEELSAEQLPRVLDEVTAAVINGNYALQANLDATKEGLYTEDKNREDINTKRNVLVVKEGNKDSEKAKILKEVLTSDECRKFIEDKYKGTVIPVF